MSNQWSHIWLAVGLLLFMGALAFMALGFQWLSKYMGLL